jgi:hypothetical protein
MKLKCQSTANVDYISLHCDGITFWTISLCWCVDVHVTPRGLGIIQRLVQQAEGGLSSSVEG